MNVTYHKQFLKMVQKLPPKASSQLANRIELFAADPLNPQLHNHSLQTPYKGSHSINITDYRAIYRLVDDETALFTHIGTHSQLYR